MLNTCTHCSALHTDYYYWQVDLLHNLQKTFKNLKNLGSLQEMFPYIEYWILNTTLCLTYKLSFILKASDGFHFHFTKFCEQLESWLHVFTRIEVSLVPREARRPPARSLLTLTFSRSRLDLLPAARASQSLPFGETLQPVSWDVLPNMSQLLRNAMATAIHNICVNLNFSPSRTSRGAGRTIPENWRRGRRVRESKSWGKVDRLLITVISD